MGCISFNDTCPASGDTENVLLQKILQSLNSGGGGGAGVSSLSINGGPPQSGAVDLTVPDGSLFLLKAGDTGTGAFFFTPTADNVTPLTLSNSITGASAIPTLAINPTWNTTGAPTALLVNATNTASSAQALLFNFQLNSVNVLNLRRDGRLTLAGRIAATDITGVGQTFASLNATTGSSPTAFILQHNLSAGIPVAGFGVTMDWNLDSTTTAGTLAARLITQWTDPTHATRTSQFVFSTFSGGALVTAMELRNGQVLGTPGSVSLPSFSQRSDVDTGVYFPFPDQIGFTLGGVTGPRFVSSGIFLPAANLIVWSGNTDPLGSSDLLLQRLGAGNLAVIAGISGAPASLEIYEATDFFPTNYSRLVARPQVGNHLIRTEAGGTGTLRTLQVGTGPRVGTDIAGISTIFHGGQSTGAGAGGSILFQTSPAGGAGAGVNALVTALTINSAGVAIHAAPVRLQGYTVATLPVGTQGDTAFVTDATAPTFGATVVGGGAVVIPVFYDGTNWIVG